MRNFLIFICLLGLATTAMADAATEKPSTTSEPAATEPAARETAAKEASAEDEFDPAKMRAEAIGEKFDELTTIDGKVYKNAVIKAADAVGIRIFHSTGASSIGYGDLPEELQLYFGYDAEEARAQKEENAKAEVKNMEQATVAGKAAQAKRNAELASHDKKLKNTEIDKQIAALKANIRKMQAGIAKTQPEVEKLNRAAAKYQSEAYYTRSYTDSNGVTRTEQHVSKSKLNRARIYRERAAREAAKIREAEGLIRKYESQITELERSRPK